MLRSAHPSEDPAHSYSGQKEAAMPYPADDKYPAIATNAAWQKKKSTLDKVHKTLVGPKLVEAEKKWKAVKWADLDDRKQSTTVAQGQSRLQKAKAAFPTIKAAQDAVKDAYTTALAQSKNSKLSTASKKALADIAKALDGAHTRLANMSDIVTILEVDSNIAATKALAVLKNVEVKLGSQVIAWGKEAKLNTDKTYLVSDVDWKVPPKMALDYLQKSVSVTAHDATGHDFARAMKITGITGTDQIRLK
jgi:hypothetical protein